MEIGSFYNLSIYDEDKLFFVSGRNAISFIINKLNITNSLIPNYLCESVYMCFNNPTFYKINNDFNINITNLKYLISKNNYEIILIINYFGYIDENINIIKDICKEKNIIILEDYTHNLFSTNLYGDICISSYRKTINTPFGALLLDRYNKFNLIQNETKINILYICISFLKIFGMILKNIKYLKIIWRPILTFCENHIQYINYKGFDYMNYFFYKYYFNLKFKNDRVNNMIYLYEKLGIKCNNIFNNTYFTYPIICKNSTYRNYLRNYLIKYNIFCPIYWPTNFINNLNNEISDQIICLPIDQRYNSIHMDYIIRIIKEFNNNYNIYDE